MIRAVIFDMDGVLIDSEIHWEKREGNFFKEYIPIWTKNDQKKIMGMTMHAIYKHLVKNYNLPISEENYKQRINKAAIQIYEKETSLLPNVKETLNFLSQHNIPMAIASSSKQEWINITLKRFELTKFFNPILSVQSLNLESKPSPQVYIKAANQLKLKPQECIVIEDAYAGALAAKSAGCFTIGFRNGFNEGQDLSKADIIAHNFIEIQKIIKKKLNLP